MTELDIAKLERQSVQDVPKVDKQSGVSDASFWAEAFQRGPILPAWGTRVRERWLRAYDRNEYNTLWQGASSGLIKKIKATPYELKGGRNLTNRFDGVLRDAHFGAGWGTFLSLILRDYLRFDGGAYAEIIAPGNPLKAPTGAVTGIAHLDSYRCLPTGDPEYPVVYYSRKGKLHVLHYTRVLHFIDLPDGDQENPGYGLCALSRAIAVVQRQLYMNRYVSGKLDDKPEPGVVIANNLNKEDRDAAYRLFRGEQSADIPPEWGKVAWFFNMNPAIKAELAAFNFSVPPEKFDYVAYINVDINELALAIGVDKQELWELSGATGTAGQSIIQAEKSEGKAPGEIRTSIEREINNKLLPDSLEFEWKTRDGRAAQQEATTAQTWAGVATSLAPLIGNKLAAELLANQVPAMTDVLFDDAGQIRLPDADRQTAEPQPLDVVVDNSAPNAASATDTQVSVDEPIMLPLIPMKHGSGQESPVEPTSTPKPSTTQVSLPEAPITKPETVRAPINASPDEVIKLMNAGMITIGEAQEKLSIPVDPATADWYMHNGVPVPKDVLLRLYETQFGRGVDTFTNAVNAPPSSEQTKDFDATREAFISAFEDLASAGQDGDLTRRRAGTVLRANLNRLGKQARLDGLLQGGVEELSDDDLDAHAVWLADQSQYVTAFMDEVYSAGLSEAQVSARAEAWSNKSLQLAYAEGVQSADANGMYIFEGEDGAESDCTTCPRLKGQKHRMKEWAAKELRPGIDTKNFDCGGWECKHRLTKTTGRASGKW